MAFIDRIPKWIKAFPLKLDKMALEQLAKSSKGSFEKPREMNFSLYDFRDDADLDAAIDKIQAAGWVCMKEPQVETPGRFVLTATKKEYIFTESGYKHDIVFFQRIADMYHAQYDGWLASN